MLAPVAPLGLCVPGAPVLLRRTYSLDSLSLGPGRPTLGPSSQQSCPDRTSTSSALTHRNLSAVAVQVGSYLQLCLTVDSSLLLQLGMFVVRMYVLGVCVYVPF